MATIDLRKNTTASTGQKVTHMYDNSPKKINQEDIINLRLDEQDKKIDKILKLLESK